MDLSIIIPIYKVEAYLDKCIQSLVKHDLKNTEIILVDDGSPDNCGKMADEWAEKYDYIKVFHTENHGQAEARNLGVKNSSGKYVTFIDSDDYVEDNFIEIYEYLDRDVDIIAGGYIAEYLNKTDIIGYSKEVLATNNAEVLDKCLEIRGNKNSVWVKIVNREFILHNNLWFISGYAEDYNWVARSLLVAKSCLLIPLNYYHYIAERPNSAMNTYKVKRLYDIISMSRSILDEASKANLSPEHLKKIKQFVGFNVLSNFRIMNRLKLEERDEAESLLIKNKDLVKYQKPLIMKLFMLGANIFGFKFMYKFAKI